MSSWRPPTGNFARTPRSTPFLRGVLARLCAGGRQAFDLVRHDVGPLEHRGVSDVSQLDRPPRRLTLRQPAQPRGGDYLILGSEDECRGRFDLVEDRQIGRTPDEQPDNGRDRFGEGPPCPWHRPTETGQFHGAFERVCREAFGMLHDDSECDFDLASGCET